MFLINKPKDELLKLILPPLVMVGVTILISIFQPRGLYIIATVTMSIMTTIFAIQSYFKNRKQYKIDLQERIDSYHQYLSDKAIVLNELSRKQKEGQLYHYPTIETLDALAESYSHRIYEKTPQHFDFLYYRLGLGNVPVSYDLSYSQQERSGKKDPLESEGYALYYRHLTIPEMPVVANLSHGPVGYIGPRPLVLEQLQLLVNQIAMFHSYHDVQFIAIMPEEEKAEWEWMRWLPHATLQEMNVRGFVYNQRTRDQVLGSLNQILRMRKNQLDEKSAKEGTLFSPHYVVLVTDETLMLDHVIMEFFTEDPTALGCSVVFVQDVMSSLSENIKTIINIKDRNTGQLVMEEGELREHDFALDHFPEKYDKERITRRLAPLNHLQNLKSSILFNYGGTHVVVDGHRATNYSYLTPEYDLEATLQQYDMEQNGLRAQVFRDAAGASKTVTKEMMEELRKLDTYLAMDSKSISGKFSSGTGNKTIKEIGVDKIKTAIASVKYPGNLAGEFLNDTIENKYFENYVGH